MKLLRVIGFLVWLGTGALMINETLGAGGIGFGKGEQKGVYGRGSGEGPVYLETYEIDGYKLEAGFMPDKAEYVWGEPMHYISYIVKNTGDKVLEFFEGGDYRGGRSESHKITAVDEKGQAVEIPEMYEMGGIMTTLALEPGEVYRKMLPVERRLTFGGPGEYTVTGKRTLKLGSLEDMFKGRSLDLPTKSSFKLTIHPYSKERMGRVIKELSDQIWAMGDVEPRLLEMTEPTELNEANRLHLAFSSLCGIEDARVVDYLAAMAKDGPTQLRVAAVKRLGGFAEVKGQDVVFMSLQDKEEVIRMAAAEALGTMKTEKAVEELIQSLKTEKGAVADSILRAMGSSQAPRVFDILVEELKGKNRQGAVDGLVLFGGDEAVAALKSCVGDEDMDFREYAVKQLGETMRQPINARWLVDVIKSRKDTNTIGDAPRLMRMYCGKRAVPALLSCLDYENPAVRSYYNYIIIYHQGWCSGGMRIPWNSDLNRDGTAAELQQNREILKALKIWVDHYYEHRMEEPVEAVPNFVSYEEDQKTWGETVDGIFIRVSVNQRVWPEGMPQLFKIEVRGELDEGSVNLLEVPKVLEVEINGEWYVREPPLEGATMGIDEGHGASFENLLLGREWRRKSDGQALDLLPGKYMMRLGLSVVPEDERTGLAISKGIQFEIIKSN